MVGRARVEPGKGGQEKEAPGLAARVARVRVALGLGARGMGARVRAATEKAVRVTVAQGRAARVKAAPATVVQGWAALGWEELEKVARDSVVDWGEQDWEEKGMVVPEKGDPGMEEPVRAGPG